MKITRSDDGKRLLLELTGEEEIFLEALGDWAAVGGNVSEDVISGAVAFMHEYEVAKGQVEN